MIIDFHTHIFPDKIAAGVIDKLQKKSRSKPYTDATAGDLLQSMQEAGIDYSVTLPVATNVRQVEKLNTIAIAEVQAQAESGAHSGLISFGGMHPDYENYKEELRRLKEGGVKGIKLHPAYQDVDFDDIRFLRIIDAASELDLIVLTHAGWDIGIPHHDFASVEQILHVIKEVSPTKLVAAHMGGWRNWKEIKSDLAGAPIWLDTAFSVGPIEPAEGTTRTPEESMNMYDSEFLELTRAHGTDHILFASDCPWSSQKTYVDRFLQMPFTEAEKAAVMGENARHLLGLS